jgi:hypothetical protein
MRRRSWALIFSLLSLVLVGLMLAAMAARSGR